MMRIAIAGLVIAGLVLGIAFLREAVETRHAVMPPDSQLVVDASASVRGPQSLAPALARGLVSTCLVESAAESEMLSFDSPDDERFRFVARPALDEPDRRQLRGCLEDLRVPRLIVDVHSMRVELRAA